MIELLAQVEGTHRKGPFTAGLVLWDDKVVEAAPIVRYMRGWSRQRVRSFVGQKGWKICVVHQLERETPEWWKTPSTCAVKSGS